MGQTYEFRCNRCGYTAKVSGGGDAGWNVIIETQVCKACSKVVDVVTGPSPANQDHTGEIAASANKCPRCGGSNLQSWTDRKCPKCGDRMRKGDLVLLWD